MSAPGTGVWLSAVRTVETLPVPSDAHVGTIVYVQSEGRWYAGMRDATGVPIFREFAFVSPASGQGPSL